MGKYTLNQDKRKSISVSELERYIFRFFKTVEHEDYSPDALLRLLCRVPNSSDYGSDWDQWDFPLKFSEAIALLERRGLLMDKVGVTHSDVHKLCLTSVGKKSKFNGIIILIDDAQEIVDSLKDEVDNLDPVVEQYYLESLRACQEGLYISSAICLGAASERAIDCLKEAIVNYDPKHKVLERKWTSDAVKYILGIFKQIFDPSVDRMLRNDLKEQLELTERLYRTNRNDAGHPRKVAKSIGRCEQENHLYMFRRYAVTIFTVINELERAS